MGKFDGVLLASDFDNTLLNTETARRTGAEVPEVSRRNREALEYFMAGGGRFAIATGRALAAFIKFADQVPMNAPGIVCNGAALYDFQKGEYLETILLDESTRRRGQETLDRFPTLAVEAYHIDNVIHAVRPNLYTRQHEHVTHVSVVEKPSLLDVPLPLGKIMFEEDHAVLEEVKAFLQSQPWAGEYEIFFSDRTLLEVTARGATKGGMVARAGGAAGHLPPARLLRRGRGQRPVHADLGGGGICPRQLRTCCPGLRGHHRGRCGPRHSGGHRVPPGQNVRLSAGNTAPLPVVAEIPGLVAGMSRYRLVS